MAEDKKPGEIIGLKVSYSKPEEVLHRLAINLAESLTGEVNWKADATCFAEKSNEWEEKAQDLEKTLELINERDGLQATGQSVEHLIKKIRYQDKETGEWKEKPSRMDPILTYTRTDIENQLEVTRSQGVEFRRKSEIFLEQAKDAKKEADRLQREIHKVQSQARTKAQEG